MPPKKKTGGATSNSASYHDQILRYAKTGVGTGEKKKGTTTSRSTEPKPLALALAL